MRRSIAIRICTKSLDNKRNYCPILSIAVRRNPTEKGVHLGVLAARHRGTYPCSDRRGSLCHGTSFQMSESRARNRGRNHASCLMALACSYSCIPTARAIGVSSIGMEERSACLHSAIIRRSVLRTRANARTRRNASWHLVSIQYSTVVPSALQQRHGLRAAAATLEDEADRLEKQSLADLIAKYREQRRQRRGRPRRRALTAPDYDRDPLVIAIARKRAGHRCEVHDCAHPTFETPEGGALHRSAPHRSTGRRRP